jgi:PAS domain S-box-containing protein
LIRMLTRAFDNLTDSEQSAKDLAKSLNISNLSLQLKNKEINDITLALDKAVILIKTDPNGKIVYANQKYCILTKYSLDQLVGKPLFYNNQGGAENVIYHHIRNKHENSKVWQSEVYDNASDGTDFYLDVTLFPVVNNDGDLYEYLVICSDITKRKITEKELQIVTEQRFLKQEEEQKIKSKSIIQGQEVERRRMAVEVHDGLGQMLTALKFNCEALESGDDYQSKVIANMKQLLQQVIVETRRISSDLLPTVLSDFGLVAALKEMVKSVNSVTDTEINFVNNFKLSGRLSYEKEIAGYRIAQESLNNALKHSQSKLVELSLYSDAEYVYLSVQDNGGGIDTAAPKDSRSGNGLRNMHERAHLVDGKLYIDSVKNKGTKVLVEIPIY